MLGSIRNFSKTIYAKILLGIVIVPFVFWGMGSVFRGGNTNGIMTITSNIFAQKDFVKFLKELSIIYLLVV